MTRESEREARGCGGGGGVSGGGSRGSCLSPRLVYFCSLLFSAPYLSSRNCQLLAQPAFRV